MNAWYYVNYLILEELYTVTTVIYLFQLNALNRKLLKINFEGATDLLMFNDWSPLKFFVIAALLFLAGIALIWRRASKWRYESLSIEEIVATVAALFFLVTLMFLIFTFINNPIMKAVMSVTAIGAAIGYCISSR